jgi:Domain of unknown function (DUF1707)
MCHASRHRSRPHVTEVRGDAPVVGEPHDLRASDAERERTVDALRAHAAAGRLDPEELEERLGRALAARSRAELAALVDDLPASGRPQAVAAPGRRHRKDPRAYLPIAALLVAIWAVTGMGYFWPVWPLLWFAVAGAMHWRSAQPLSLR